MDDDLDLLMSLVDEEAGREVPSEADLPSSSHAADGGPPPSPEVPARGRAGGLAAAFASVIPKETRKLEVTEDTKRSKKPHDENVEPHTGLRIKNRLIPSLVIKEKFSDLNFVQLCDLQSAVKRNNFASQWATGAVLIEKLKPKEGSNGRKFGIWKLSDLSGTMITLFLFGEAYADHWKESEGCILAVLSPKVKQEDKPSPGQLGFFLAVQDSHQLLKMGTSADYAVCKGERRDGLPCSMVINRSEGEYCHFHAAKAYQKLKKFRAELSGSMAMNKPRKAKPFQSGVFVSKQPITARKPLKHVTVQSVKEYASKGKVSANSAGYRNFLHMAETQEKENAVKRAKAKGEKLVPEKRPFRQAPVEIDASAYNALKKIRTSSTFTAPRYSKTPPQETPPLKRTPQPFVSAFGITTINGVRVESSGQGKGKARDSRDCTGVPRTGKEALEVPKEKRHLQSTEKGHLGGTRSRLPNGVRVEKSKTSEQEKGKSRDSGDRTGVPRELLEALEVPKEKRGSQSKETGHLGAARARSPRRSSYSVSDEEGPSADIVRRYADELKRKGYKSQEKAKMMDLEDDEESEDQMKAQAIAMMGSRPGVDKASPPVSSFAKAFGGVVSRSAKEGDSKYSHLADEAEGEHLQKSMAVLERKEQLFEKLEKITKTIIKAWCCKECKLVTERKPIECQARGHAVQFLKETTKRFFKCVDCKQRTAVVHFAYPKDPCSKCRSLHFKETSMYTCPSGVVNPVASRENFLARGTEHAFSLKATFDAPIQNASVEIVVGCS